MEINNDYKQQITLAFMKLDELKALNLKPKSQIWYTKIDDLRGAMSQGGYFVRLVEKNIEGASREIVGMPAVPFIEIGHHCRNSKIEEINPYSLDRILEIYAVDRKR